MKKRGIKGIFEKEGYTKKKTAIALIILIIALIIFAGYFFVFKTGLCSDKKCFDDALRSCKKVYWTREDSGASWLYTIKGNAEKDSCKVEVKLLKINQGKIDMERLQNKKMLCSVMKGYTQFPEKEISKCTGILKEEMQDIIIQRMHNYLLENVGEIKETFSGI